MTTTVTHLEITGGPYHGRRLAHPYPVLAVTGHHDGRQWTYEPTGRTTPDGYHVWTLTHTGGAS